MISLISKKLDLKEVDVTRNYGVEEGGREGERWLMNAKLQLGINSGVLSCCRMPMINKNVLYISKWSEE